jgi:RNA polymerase sigma-70 factor (ECF subfamily)
MAKKVLTTGEIESLVEKAQSGDTGAFGDLYDFFIDPIYRYVFFKVKKDDALDLTENVFLKVWENIGSYRLTSGSSFSSWVYRIAHNAVVDYYRMEKEHAELDANTADERKHNDPVVMTERKLGQDALKSALSKLKKPYQQIILMKYINELENHEIAKVLRKSEGSIRILKFRALKALKRILEEMRITY